MRRRETGGINNSSDAGVYSIKIDYSGLGHKLKAERKRQHYTQEQVSEAIGITPAFVGHIERGERGPSLDTLIRFCNLYGVTMDYLLSDMLPAEKSNTAAALNLLLEDMTPMQQSAVLDIVRTIARHL